jgi:hypothetical protein
VNCKSCDKVLHASQNFCDYCGAKIIHNRLTPKVLLHQINEQFLSIDNKFLRTFIDLFKQPEDVIAGYINGTRKKYIDVLQYFAISLTLAGIQFYLIKTFYIEQLEDPFQMIDPNLKDNEFMRNYQKTMNDMMDDGSNFQSLMYILSVPFTAIGTWIAYKFTGYKRFNLTEHFVINLYYSGQTIIFMSISYILGAVIGINLTISTVLMTLLGIVYQIYVFKKVTQQTTLETVAKIALSYFVLGLQFLILMILFVLVIVILKLTNII